MKLIVLPIALIGDFAGWIVESARAVHFPMIPLTGVDPTLAVVESSISMTQTIFCLPLIPTIIIFAIGLAEIRRARDWTYRKRTRYITSRLYILITHFLFLSSRYHFIGIYEFIHWSLSLVVVGLEGLVNGVALFETGLVHNFNVEVAL